MQIVAVAKSLLPRSLDHAIVATSKNRSRNRIDDGDHVFPITRGTSAMEVGFVIWLSRHRDGVLLLWCHSSIVRSLIAQVTRAPFARHVLFFNEITVTW